MLTAVQASLDTFSLITGGTGGDLKTEEDFILSLNNFECRGRSVEVIRQKLVRYMFPVFSLILAYSTFTFTVAAYFLIHGVLLSGGTLNMMICTSTCVVYLCNLGHTFNNEVISYPCLI
ncbi:hypothetical protein Pmani_011596 [Petrolisthes manimaculis]|uniref:Uncharacterized protein n=1 Tax=Petrolisthes manimaculis TaxID=1843537 RepID=A0AAE1Q273_9EUCA|nr:hypothetical protein Pmani_011596 [Petrolisthes manimaculis]